MKRFLPLLLLLAFVSTTSTQEVGELTVEGNRRVESSLILSTCPLQRGDFLTPDALSACIRGVYALGLFKDVRADTQMVDGKVLIKIVVDENPVLDELSFDGNRHVKQKDLRQKLEIREGDVISQYKIFNSVQKLKQLYEEKKFLLTQITPVLTEEDGRAALVFQIDEGKKQKIREIRIEGTRAFPGSRIEKLMKNREKEWYRSAEFRPDLLDEDIEAIEKFYQSQGYIEAEVLAPELIYQEDDEWVTIVIKVDEGIRYYIGDIQFAGNEFFSVDVLTNQLTVSRGEPYNKEKVDATLEKLYSLYYDEGYIYAQFVPDEWARQDTVDITFQVSEGEPARVRKVEIEGNDQTREKVIRRELVIYPGDIFKRSKLIRSQQEIFNLGYFQNILIDSRTSGSEIMSSEEARPLTSWWRREAGSRTWRWDSPNPGFSTTRFQWEQIFTISLEFENTGMRKAEVEISDSASPSLFSITPWRTGDILSVISGSSTSKRGTCRSTVKNSRKDSSARAQQESH